MQDVARTDLLTREFLARLFGDEGASSGGEDVLIRFALSRLTAAKEVVEQVC